ncbi:unnamed protein product [Candidula unifasciata]|uniref:Uncharacterized protein n=1 Tax=Candidula unifasciata TaxID=100452 RepID=A0A8S3YSV9_9EUPU|nr:unnamed protein product [Candidula unifasciata]
MPLSHSQNFEGFVYGGFGCSSIQSLCQKRKMDIHEGRPLEDRDNRDMKTDHHGNSPKRQCQRVSSECQSFECHQNGGLGEDVNMEEERADVSQNDSPLSIDQSVSSCCQQGVSESPSSMEADSLPTFESHLQSHTANAVSSPQNITPGTDRRGLKQSPVSGRLFCHCSASWRGMYGLDIGYITDYY